MNVSLTSRCWKQLLLPALALAACLWFAFLRKSSGDIFEEVLAAAARPDDIILVSGDHHLDPGAVKTRHLYAIESAAVNFFPASLDITMTAQGKTERIERKSFKGRVLLLSSGTPPVEILGNLITIPVGRSMISIILPAMIHGNQWDLMQFFQSARVARKTKDRSTSCPVKAGGFSCGGEDWEDVRILQIPFAGVVQQCIFAHPANNSTLAIDFKIPTATASFYVAGGIDDMGVGYPHGTPVNVKVTLEGDGAGDTPQVLGELAFENKPGFFSQKIALPGSLEPGDSLSFEITSQDQNTRHFCFTGRGTGK
ncbi:MAG: hypothetical protein ABIJ56_13730 [Pseudomonadota bacterium]